MTTTKTIAKTTIITVKNADGDPDTTATVLIQNKIKYTPKVSVIIPVYNVEQYLRECLDSVVNQTLKEIEIICVDDGSTDSSLEILKEYAKKDNRITIITQENLHAGVARNAGLSVAKGEYLSFIDSDDFFELNMLEEMYNKGIKNKSDIVVCSADMYNNISKQTKSVSYLLCDDFTQKEDLIYEINSNIWTKIYNRQFIRETNTFFQNLTSCNDVYFSYITWLFSTKISTVRKVFYHYRIKHLNSISSSRGNQAKNIIDVYIALKNKLFSDWNKYKQTIINNIQKNIRYELRNCTKADAITMEKHAQTILTKTDWDYFKPCFSIVHENKLYHLVRHLSELKIFKNLKKTQPAKF